MNFPILLKPRPMRTVAVTKSAILQNDLRYFRKKNDARRHHADPPPVKGHASRPEGQDL
jgi:hypothetical protein